MEGKQEGNGGSAIMSCPHCVHCQSGVVKGGLSVSFSSGQGKNNEEKRETPKFPVRGPARQYTEAFEIAWKAYPRREQKFEAFAVWMIRAREVGGEPKLVTLVLGSLRWQVPAWLKEGPQFAPYFERYLKRRKWEDEPMPTFERQAIPRQVD